MTMVHSESRNTVQGKAAHDAAAAGNPVRMGGVYRTTLAGVAAGDVVDLFLDAAGRMQTALPGTITADKDILANDSDKTITVPTGKQWLVICIQVYYAATSTVGNRMLRPIFGIGGETLMLIVNPPADIAAGEEWRVNWQAGGSAGTFEVTEKTWTMPLPVGLWLDAADTIQVTDSAAIDAAADDMQVYITVLERDSA
jgi:hypothetical protein